MNHFPTLVIASRQSPLALLQTQEFIEKLRHLHGWVNTGVLPLVTSGDVLSLKGNQAEASSSGKGLFTNELHQKVLAKEAICGVHSLKDLETDLPPGLVIGCVLEREDPRDVFVASLNAKVDTVSGNICLATSSPRRMAQLKGYYPGLQVEPIRGNIGTRLTKVDASGMEGLVLAAAGLKRLGLVSRITAYFPLETLLPCPGQGALAVVCREDDQKFLDLIRPLDHLPTRCAITAERSFLRALGGSCRTPLAAYALQEKESLVLEGFVATWNGKDIYRYQETCLLTPENVLYQSEQLGEHVASFLKAKAPAIISSWMM